MKLKKIAAILLAVVLALGATACASENARWIATVDGQNIPSGIYLSYLIDAYNEAYSEVEDPAKDVLKQQIEGGSSADWMTVRADEKLRNYAAVEKQFDVQGLTIDEVTSAMLDQQAQYQWQYYGSVYEKNGISYESYLKALTNSYKENALFEAQYGPEGKTPVSDEDVRNAFSENYVRARYITASFADPNTGAPLSAEEQQRVLDTLGTVQTAAAAEGADFSSAILASEKEQAAKDGREESTVHEHDATTHVSYMDKTNTAYSAEFIQKLEGMAMGEIQILTTDTTAYLLQKLDINEVPEDIEDYRATLLVRLKGDAFQTQQNAWAAELDIQYVQESKNLYKPGKLKFE